MSQGFAAETGLVNMVPVHDIALLSNVGGLWSADVYTVPTGRILALDSAHLVCFSGLVPSAQIIRLKDDTGTLAASLIREDPGGLNKPTNIVNMVWLLESWIITFEISGGDATTDMVWSFSGRLFDVV